MATEIAAGATPLDQPVAPARNRRDPDALDAWFNYLNTLYLRRGWHPAIAAIEAQLEAKRRIRPVLP
jgi:hypothetical protein